MSRVIEDRDNLSDEDVLYLVGRAQMSDQEAADRLGCSVEDVRTELDVSVAESPVRNRANTGDANTYGESIEDLERRLELARAAQGIKSGGEQIGDESTTGFQLEDEDEDEEETEPGFDPDDVDTWSKSQRVEVLERYGIEAADNKRSQVRALDEYRRENPDADFSVSE